MNNKFMVGDFVRCKLGGPVMIISTAPIQQNQFGQAIVIGLGNGVPVNQNRQYNCVWWIQNNFNGGVGGDTAGSWAVYNFHEDMLEEAKQV